MKVVIRARCVRHAANAYTAHVASVTGECKHDSEDRNKMDEKGGVKEKPAT